ncbi:hypothetical protein B0G81_5995 [Paraburkholderia sp. BL6665CI2N2]|nr:hypothetical protein B0G81_5995 [Paraburkholderia sp. BL6665CI2N2]
MQIVHVVKSASTVTLSVACMLSNRLASESHEVCVEYSRRSETPPNYLLSPPNVALRQFHMKAER